jgi:hypothetical protein
LKIDYLAKSSSIFALSSSPLKSLATILPEASSIKVAGIVDYIALQLVHPKFQIRNMRPLIYLLRWLLSI